MSRFADFAILRITNYTYCSDIPGFIKYTRAVKSAAIKRLESKSNIYVEFARIIGCMIAHKQLFSPYIMPDTLIGQIRMVDCRLFA